MGTRAARNDKKERMRNDKKSNNNYNNFMKQAKPLKNKKFKINLWKLTTNFCLLVLVFNFSLVRAEETSVREETGPAADSASSLPADLGQDAPVGQPSATVDSSAGSGQSAPAAEAPTSGTVTIVEPEAPTQPNLENSLESARQDSDLPIGQAGSPTPINSASSSNDEIGQVLGEQSTESLTPLISTSTKPIIFDLSEPQATATPETATGDTVNNVAGESEFAGGGSIIHEVITGIIRDANIKQLTILAQWQMSDEKTQGKYLGADASALAGAQFLPSGQFETAKPVAVCALVADAGGVANLNNVTARVNYPEAIAKAVNQAGETSGCGQLKGEFNLEKINFEEAAALVCDTLRNNNNNLLAWGSDKIDNLVYSYDHLCGQDGLLVKQAAELYCAETSLAYDDPAGDYLIKVSAKNSGGAAVTGENYLKYLELTTFENDFSEILYGTVKLNELKVLKGDQDFATSTAPTVRNTGNTRLQIKIWQNDFNLGKTGADWNLAYQAKIGDKANFAAYDPEQTTALSDLVELGQAINADFAILVKKFPESSSEAAFWGKMTLAADKAPTLGCE